MSNLTKQELIDRRYLRMADIWSENSYARRRKVGALLVKDKMIISDGYNGTPSGFENDCEISESKSSPGTNCPIFRDSEVKPDTTATRCSVGFTCSNCPHGVSNKIYKTKSYVLHAEANAITKVAKSNNSSEGSTLYVTTSPCMECSKLIIQAGIKRVVYRDLYHNTDGLNILKRANIELVHIPNPDEV